MLLGNPDIFAIECHHDPIFNETNRVFGRMCLWICGARLGDIEEPACMLDVTAHSFGFVLEHLALNPDPDLATLTDRKAFDLIDSKLYREEKRDSRQIMEDMERFWRHDFLNNGGESFDRTTSFFVRDRDNVRILFMDSTTGFHSGRMSVAMFEEQIRAFLDWIEVERKELAN